MTATDVTTPAENAPALGELITDEMRAQYRDEGYFLLERALSDDQLELLREVADYAVAKVDAQMDAAGVDQMGINTKGRRYFSHMIYQDRPELRSFLFSDLMAEICRATLGPEAYMFWEQYVVKAGDPDTTFAWHQDSGYVHEDHAPYLTCWIALDDVTEENGIGLSPAVLAIGHQELREAPARRDAQRRGLLLRVRPGRAGGRARRVDRGVLLGRHPPQRGEPDRQVRRVYLASTPTK